MSTKDILEIIVIPISLAFIALLWPVIQSWNRRRTFQRLILRELAEISPHPQMPTGANWWQHQAKAFVHQKIFSEPSENRDFILSLDPNLVYFVTQLWQAKEEKNWEQWKYCLECLSDSRWDKKRLIATAT